MTLLEAKPGSIIAELDAARAAYKEQHEHAQRLVLERNAVYKERNALVCALSKLFAAGTDYAGTAWLARHPDDPAWDPEWKTIVFFDTPAAGQMSWHIHDREVPLFAHLSWGPNNWDGHTTAEKYERLSKL